MDSQLLFLSSMLLTNVGSRYIINDIVEHFDTILKHPLSKTIILFAMCYVASKDILISAIYTVFISLLLYSSKNPLKHNNVIVPNYIRKKKY